MPLRRCHAKRKKDFKAHTEEVNQFITELEKDVERTRKENRAKQRELKRNFLRPKLLLGKTKRQKKKEREE